MVSFKKAVLITALVFVVVLVLFIDNDAYQRVALSFVHKGNRLTGTIMLPENILGPFPVVVFVHGDGAMSYDAYGYYHPLWNRLAKQGIASFSWDKPGVGGSQGDWENQTMDDRADETIAAIEVLKKRSDIDANKIGLIGYSQAGWVVPLVAGKQNNMDFTILVSPVINWMDQGAYLTEKRLAGEGYSQIRIKQAVERHYNNSENYFASTSTYDRYIQAYQEESIANRNGETPMTPQRFRFAKLNWHYDARDSLKDINCPTLVLFGEYDLNVNITESIEVYQEQFTASGNQDLDIRVFPKAQHALLKSKYFDEIVPGILFITKFEVLGEDAFVDHYLDFVVNWVAEKVFE
jgi:pimeloyl-ACP methyl ester carboxylesterase